MSAPAAAATTTTTTAAPVAESTGIKVFVGNLSFKTKDAQLQTEFESAGKVVRAKVIRDYNHRSLGYGFVEMATLEDAKRAIDAMNKKTLDERQINVELAKPREEGAARTPTAPGEAPAGAARRRGGARRGGSGAARGGARQASGAPRSPTATTGGSPAPVANRPPSKTSLFVSNLPFSTDDASLAKIFTDRKFPVKKAMVVVRQNGRSKGFGFVEFDNEETQTKALEATNGLEVDGRKIIVRIALTELHDNNASPVANNTATTAAPASGKQEQAAPAAEPKKQQQQQQPVAKK
jgi:RNA recognition motif-containing protein